MINEITVNSNNAIEMSRGELLNWLNQFLKTNLTKIQQLGSGAIYCQLIDALYPGKVPMTKVNWKAKFDYEFVNNFKILQQTFTKLGILKHIQVERLIKCKYQDNLQFLQWFKKLFDNSNQPKEYNPMIRRGQEFDKKKEKQNRVMHSSSSRQMQQSSQKSVTLEVPNERPNINIKTCQSFLTHQRLEEQERTIRLSESKINSMMLGSGINCPEDSFKMLDCSWRNQLKDQAFVEERQFYLKKFKEIEHLFEDWKEERSSKDLMEEVRKIIMVAPTVDWSIQNGQFSQSIPTSLQQIEQNQ